MRIAVLKVGALGDVLRTTALLPGFRRLYPGLDLTWVTSAQALPLLEGNPLVQRTVDYREPGPREWAGLNYDWVISLDDDVEVCRLASKLSCRRLSGSYADGAGELRYTSDLEEWFGMGRLRRPEDGGLERANQLKRINTDDYGSILYRGLGLPLPVEPPALTVPEEDKARVRDWIRANNLAARTLIGLNTGAGDRWKYKSWGIDQTVELARQLSHRPGTAAVVLGGEAERSRNQEIAARAGSPGVIAAPCDLSLLSFAALIGNLAVLVTSDSLAMHIGIALERPVVAFFGPTSSSEINLFGRGEKIATQLECRCCYLPDCDVRPHCMQSISVERMSAAVLHSIGAPGPFAQRGS